VALVVGVEVWPFSPEVDCECVAEPETTLPVELAGTEAEGEGVDAGLVAGVEVVGSCGPWVDGAAEVGTPGWLVTQTV
jgi:hypothetical protein